MKGNVDSRAALQTIASHLLQAVARGDAAAAEGHTEVYRAILKAAGRQQKEVQPRL